MGKKSNKKQKQRTSPPSPPSKPSAHSAAPPSKPSQAALSAPHASPSRPKQSVAGSLPAKILSRIFELTPTESEGGERSARELQIDRHSHARVCRDWRQAHLARGRFLFVGCEDRLGKLIELARANGKFSEQVRGVEILWVGRTDRVLERVARLVGLCKRVRGIRLRKPDMGDEDLNRAAQLGRLLSGFLGLGELRSLEFDFKGVVRVDKLAHSSKLSAIRSHLVHLALAIDSKPTFELFSALLVTSRATLRGLEVHFKSACVLEKDVLAAIAPLAPRLCSLILVNGKQPAGGKKHKLGYLTPLLSKMSSLEHLDIGVRELCPSELEEAFVHCASLVSLTLRVKSIEETRQTPPQTINDLLATAPRSLTRLKLEIDNFAHLDKLVWKPSDLCRLTRLGKSCGVAVAFVAQEEGPSEKLLEELDELGLAEEIAGEMDSEELFFMHMVQGMFGATRGRR